MWWEIIKSETVSLPDDIRPIVREILKTYKSGGVFTQQRGFVRLRLRMFSGTFHGHASNHHHDVVNKLIASLNHLKDFEAAEDEFGVSYDFITRYHPLYDVFDNGGSDTTSFSVRLYIDVEKDWNYHLELTDSAFSTAEEKLKALRATNIPPKPLSELDPKDRQTVRSIIEG